MVNTKIEYENGYLKGKYAQSYWDKKNEIKLLNDEKQLKSALFMSIGSTIALSQIAESVFYNITRIKKIIDSNPPEDKIKQVIDETLTSFSIDEVEIEAAPGLGTVLNNLRQSHLITDDEHEDIKFIKNNRNNFAHNYFLKYPKALKGTKEMRLLVVQCYYTILSLNQLINVVFKRFKDDTIFSHPSMEQFLSDFNQLFIGEFKG
jgi:hypothetical protein